MPKIIQDEQQIKALSDISEMLSTMTAIDNLLTSPDPFYIVSKDGGNGRSVKVQLGTKESGRMDTILTSQRQRLVKEVQTLAIRQKIALDDEDLKLLGVSEEQGKRTDAEVDPA